MAVVTEAMLRTELADPGRGGITRYEVPAGTVVTPSARAWLVDRRIDLVIGTRVVSGTSHSESPGEPVSALPLFIKPDRFDVVDGSQVAEKPEHLTALRGNLLVPKNHPQIRFRGRLDALEADIVIMQVRFGQLGLPKAVDALGEVLRYVKQILRAEVLDVPFEELPLFGYDEAELRQRSHFPRRYYGLPHFAATAADGEAVVLLNRLRTTVREVELSAYDAFATDGTAEPARVDIIRALNRLSSAVYLMMYAAKTGEYG